MSLQYLRLPESKNVLNKPTKKQRKINPYLMGACMLKGHRSHIERAPKVENFKQ